MESPSIYKVTFYDFNHCNAFLFDVPSLKKKNAYIPYLLYQINGRDYHSKIELSRLDTKETEIKQVDISKYIPDKVQFLNDRFEDYKAVQIAWMDFDYDTLNDKLTNELYNQYEMQLETLKAKKQKNVMSGFNNKGMDITNLIEENDLITVIVSLNVVQKDYIEENGKCVRGDQYRDNIMNYRLTFVSRLDKDDKKCPNCGNPLEDISSQTCPSCRSLITLTPKKWVMSKKQVISQR